ncbi:sugar phosphate isomerase/epimerase [Streptomyces kunmingensis]|uniref:Sugar phosphate isomerase/epimerase n=1 Tax=Streptomyces kunmingensis TaxID=68225 RepID=A0ABU6C6H2_9ACTN|nr:sugar phosphate isomerase/epimerase family protein [Streptomyces kunmingensis]MEB3960222.1 sugar phosphate isomerase/epimerase [Streptomyces kunmingensis]
MSKAGSHSTPGWEEWPIAAAMLQFANTTPDGGSIQDADPEVWAEALREVAGAGFEQVDPTDSWLRVADLSPARRDDFTRVVKEAGLTVPALSTARRSVIDPVHGADNLAYSHRVVDTAAELGAAVVSFGLFEALAPAQREALWFWTAPGPRNPDDPETWRLAVARIRELGEHAQSVGVDVSLEMYEDTYLGTADDAVRFVRAVDHPRVGLNPDLGNLQRLHRPVEAARVMVEKTLPYANYWHVKNYFRAEDASTGAVLTFPAPMEYGVIDYRHALRYAVEHGFRGAFCVEHYGGDGLSVSATNRAYLRRLLSQTPGVGPRP